MGGSNEDLVKQIHETRKLHANGVILFDWAHTTDQYTQVLASSAFKPNTTISATQTTKKKKRWIFKKQ